MIESEVQDSLFKPGCDASIQHVKAEIGGEASSTEDANPNHMHEQTVGYVMMSPRYQSDRLTKVGHSPELPIQKTLR